MEILGWGIQAKAQDSLDHLSVRLHSSSPCGSGTPITLCGGEPVFRTRDEVSRSVCKKCISMLREEQPALYVAMRLKGIIYDQ